MQLVTTPVFNPDTRPACLLRCTLVAVCFPLYAVTELKQDKLSLGGKQQCQAGSSAAEIP